MNIVFVSGSVVGTKTRRAITELKKVWSKQDAAAQIEIIDLKALKLPFCDGRHFLDYEEDVVATLKKVVEADVVVFGTPVFQASIPGSLKNFFDLLPQDALRETVTGIVVTAGSSKHYLMAEQHLKPILSYMKAVVVSTYVYILAEDFVGNDLVKDDVDLRLARLAEDLIFTTEAKRYIQKKQEEAYGF